MSFILAVLWLLFTDILFHLINHHMYKIKSLFLGKVESIMFILPQIRKSLSFKFKIFSALFNFNIKRVQLCIKTFLFVSIFL